MQWGNNMHKINDAGGINMWILFAIGSSFFAGITAILAKCGIQKTDSDVATAVRTIVVLIFSWLMVPVTGTLSGIKDISGHTLLFLVLSGLATGASWLCYFHALQKHLNKINSSRPSFWRIGSVNNCYSPHISPMGSNQIHFIKYKSCFRKSKYYLLF